MFREALVFVVALKPFFPIGLMIGAAFLSVMGGGGGWGVVKKKIYRAKW